ncbi:YbaY family lipoprotein [Tahibacter amnicola]|uniref:YbaY family lipoprotein n=1 Tax=Tahibacter amnicola TaxID=2976241 RepID=A0ABY6BHT2_9GAMM|nr:YbaY family lipoprotein [Tahibacter amnicola]UXI68171.1 YbaY family lipoprotein [Tahibacter amnicola]
MHKLALPLLIASVGLVACGPSTDANKPAAQASQAAIASAVTGQVALKVPAQLSPAATLTLELFNVSAKPKVQVASSTTNVAAMPMPFKLDVEPGKIDPNSFYILIARVKDGERSYLAPREYPVLTKGSPAKVEIQLAPEPTASEKLESEYGMLERAIGGMKVAKGASEDETSTTAWDGFFDKNGLRYIREITDYGDKGRVNIYFAYHENGKPMAVVQERVAAMAEKPNSVTRLGWDAQGLFVLHTKKEGGAVTDVSEADAKPLHDRAVARFDTVSKKKPN